mmetsp:Transcript_62819/g.141918  ORF Transcript_62819/g.141918 Transcript_62819/m.141918 type:complete len:690 (+) Transcript_62819:58-2127(+)
MDVAGGRSDGNGPELEAAAGVAATDEDAEEEGGESQLQQFLRQISTKRVGTSSSSGTAPAANSKRSFTTLLSASPASLEWDMSVVAGTKTILSRSVGRAKPGELCCILGPSGAGKSTLLNVLAGRQLNNRVFRIDGDLRVNGRSVEPWVLRPRVAYVMQKDEFFATETPREALFFSARLRMPAHHLSRLEEKGQIHCHIAELLKSLGLSDCCDRPIGGASLNGISNGERKRVSIGVELITRPSIVFLDEPTTGLDSFSAWQVMRFLKELADNGCTVICTMHQPSSEIFTLVDRVICLCHQHAIYQGKATELPRWLERSGYPCPVEYNPADYVMFLMETLPRDVIESLGDQGGMSRDSSFRPSVDGHHSAKGLNPSKLRKSFFLQVRCLTQREWRNLRRDSSSMKLRFVLTILLSLLFSVVFMDVGEHPVLPELQRRIGPWNHPIFSRHRGLRCLRRTCIRLFVPNANLLRQQLQMELEYHYKAVVQVGFVAMFSACQPTILSFPLERPVFLREFSANMYGTVAYFISKLLVEVPLGAVQALLALGISHPLMRFQGDFLEMWAAVCLLNACSVCFSLLIGTVVRFPRESGAIGPLVFVPQLLMSGTFIPVQAIPPFMRWMQYFSFLQYGVKILASVEFRRTAPMLRRIIFRTMEVDPELTHVYICLLFLMCLVFSCVAVRILTQKAHSVY